jgi:phosphoribosylformimino-5-aminoimidazole carboxamide ribotide isomerase
MIVIPSIDLSQGLCVRPRTTEDADDVRVGHPVVVARSWAHAGFHRLDVRDLDAENGHGSNAGIVEDVIRDGALDIQAGGGVQSIPQIERFIDAGARRVVVSHRAIEEPRWLASAADQYPGLLVVRTDVRERRVVTRGWVRNLPLDIFDLVEDLEGLPLGGLLLTALGGNGHRTPADLAMLEDVAESCEFPVIAVDGASTINELRALEHRGLGAVLLGDVLYSGALDARAVAQEFGG